MSGPVRDVWAVNRARARAGLRPLPTPLRTERNPHMAGTRWRFSLIAGADVADASELLGLAERPDTPPSVAKALREIALSRPVELPFTEAGPLSGLLRFSDLHHLVHAEEISR